MAAPERKSSNRAGLGNSERLEARVSRAQKQLFQRAAALRGVTLTDFMVGSMQTAATLALEQHDVIRLTIEDRQKFVDVLLNPPAPNAALKRAAIRYRKMRERP